MIYGGNLHYVFVVTTFSIVAENAISDAQIVCIFYTFLFAFIDLVVTAVTVFIAVTAAVFVTAVLDVDKIVDFLGSINLVFQFVGTVELVVQLMFAQRNLNPLYNRTVANSIPAVMFIN